jgi:glucose/arabinose dehydrogenase
VIPSPVASAIGTVYQPSFQPFMSGFSNLTFVTSPEDGSGDLYVVEQSGRVFRLGDGGSATTPWLDISDRISSGGERGLLGLAFDPQFESNGRFLVDYTDVNGNSVISEFDAVAGGPVDATAERVVLTQDQPFPNHNGGMLAFDKFGNLYIGFGDGGSGGDPLGNGQSVKTFLGKILRISPEDGGYSVPLDNPLVGADVGLHEIWDWGVRNPWRFSFDRKSGGLFIGDVGQSQTEEIDVEPAGQGGRNYGWNIMEGDHCYNASSCNETGLTLPVVTYSHAGGNCSVIGGYVYRGSRFPGFDGRYFFADLCSANVWTLDADAALAGQPVTASLFAHLPFSPTTFGEDEAGELYVAGQGGQIYSLR